MSKDPFTASHYRTHMPAVFNRPMTTLAFQNDTFIILESTDDIDYDSIGAFLENYKAGVKGSVQIGPHFEVNLKSQEFILNGYQLKDAWLVSAASQQKFYIPIMFAEDKVVETVFYFYHMAKADA